MREISDEQARSLWEALSPDDQARFRSYWRGAPHVGRAREYLSQFRTEHGWDIDQSNAVGRYLRTLPFWTEPEGAA